MNNELDWIKDIYSFCSCGAEQIIVTKRWRDSWFVIVVCPACESYIEIELDTPNEAAVRY